MVCGTTTIAGAREVHLFDEEGVAAVSTFSPLAECDRIGCNEFRQWPLVANTLSGTTGPWSWPGGDGPAEIVICTNHDEWLESVAADLGVGVVPAVAARHNRHSALRFIPTNGAPLAPVRLAYLPNAPQALIRPFLDAATSGPARG